MRKIGSVPIFLVTLVLAGCAALPPVPPGEPAFAVFGDVPYSEGQVRVLDSLIDDLNRQPLAFVAHVGDITSGHGPCDDGWLEARARQFSRIAHPFILLPGDNEWTDCHRAGFDPLERLVKWRSLFCFKEKLAVERQPGEYCEHVRWEYQGMLFVALNVPGSNNNLGRTKAMDAEHERRMTAAFEWLDDSVAAAEERRLAKVVVLMQADPFLRHSPDGYARLRTVLAAHAKWLGAGHLVLVHGDSHVHRDDEPLAGLRRIEVWGSPVIAWLRFTARDGELREEVAGPY